LRPVGITRRTVKGWPRNVPLTLSIFAGLRAPSAAGDGRDENLPRSTAI
jgi:hypothetical protein